MWWLVWLVWLVSEYKERGMNYLSAMFFGVYMWRLVWLVWLGSGGKEREMDYLSDKCSVYVFVGSFS